MIQFFVPGVPVPKGSAKAFLNKVTGRAIVLQTNREKQKPWVSMIGMVAREAGVKLLQGPVGLQIVFVMPRPKYHYGTGKNSAMLKPSAPTWHDKTPDLDKLERCVLDALTGIAYLDDSQVALISRKEKQYGEQPGVLLQVWGL